MPACVVNFSLSIVNAKIEQRSPSPQMHENVLTAYFTHKFDHLVVDMEAKVGVKLCHANSLTCNT